MEDKPNLDHYKLIHTYDECSFCKLGIYSDGDSGNSSMYWVHLEFDSQWGWIFNKEKTTETEEKDIWIKIVGEWELYELIKGFQAFNLKNYES